MFDIKKFTAFCICISVVNAANAFEWVDKIITTGKGRLELVTNYFLFSSSTMVEVGLPIEIKEGDMLNIVYEEDGEIIKRQFPVAGITVRDELCWIYSVVPQRHGNNVRDKIYVKPCKYK